VIRNDASKLYNITVNERSGRIHLAIERYDGKPIRCGWDRLQQIKNEYVGEHVTMVEYFPPNDELINEVNRRHLWSTNDVLPM